MGDFFSTSHWHSSIECRCRRWTRCGCSAWLPLVMYILISTTMPVIEICTLKNCPNLFDYLFINAHLYNRYTLYLIPSFFFTLFHFSRHTQSAGNRFACFSFASARFSDTAQPVSRHEHGLGQPVRCVCFVTGNHTHAKEQQFGDVDSCNIGTHRSPSPNRDRFKYF